MENSEREAHLLALRTGKSFGEIVHEAVANDPVLKMLARMREQVMKVAEPYAIISNFGKNFEMKLDEASEKRLAELEEKAKARIEELSTQYKLALK